MKSKIVATMITIAVSGLLFMVAGCATVWNATFDPGADANQFVGALYFSRNPNDRPFYNACMTKLIPPGKAGQWFYGGPGPLTPFTPKDEKYFYSLPSEAQRGLLVEPFKKPGFFARTTPGGQEIMADNTKAFEQAPLGAISEIDDEIQDADMARTNKSLSVNNN
jgi:hypothetical protein